MSPRRTSRPGRLAAFLLAALAALPAYSATYYVSPSGDDANPGTSPSAPWRTCAKVNAFVLSPSDSVLFERGGLWRENIFPSAGGTSTAPITFGAYGTGARPVISGANVVTGWTPHLTGSAGTYKAPLATATLMVTSGNNYLRPATLGPDALPAGYYFWDSATGTLYINDGAGDPNTSGRLIAAGQRGSAISCNTNRDFIIVENLRLEKTNNPLIPTSAGAEDWIIRDCELFFGRAGGSFAGGGLHLDGNNRAKVLNCRISYIQGDGIFFYRATGGEFRGNVIDQIQDRGGSGGPDCIQLLGNPFVPLNGFIIADNVVSRESRDTTKGCIIAENGSNGLISGNRVYKGRFGIAVYVNDTVVEKNYIEDAGSNDAIRMTENQGMTNVTVRYNIVNGCSTNGLKFGNSADPVTPMSGMKVYNNLFWGTYYGIQAGVPISGEIRNNIVWNNSTSHQTRLFVSSVIPGETLVANHNIYSDKNNTVRMIGWLGVNYNDLASFQAATGQDLASSTTKPLWTSETAPRDFHPLAGSSTINTGANLGLVSDYDGTPVPQGGAPDIGPYEFYIPPADLAPVADAYVRGGTAYANQNFGAVTTLVVKDGTSADLDRQSLLKFDLSAYSAPVSQAFLNLPVASLESGINTTGEVRSVADDSWTETGVTWNNQPAAVALLGGAPVVAGTTGVSVDVTAFVNAQIAGDKTASFKLTQPAGANKFINYHSRETSTPPLLIVTP